MRQVSSERPGFAPCPPPRWSRTGGPWAPSWSCAPLSAPSPPTRSPSSRPSPSRRRSPWRMPGCPGSSRRATPGCVTNAVVCNPPRFCGAYDASILLREGDNFRGAAHHGPLSAPPALVPVVRGSVAGRCVLEGRPVHVVDLLAEAAEFPVASAFAREGGFRAMLSVPLLREGEATGVIQLRRLEAEPFTERQISLLQSFAPQAVIAIENVRLFTELGARNHDLSESLEQQTATSEILRVISSSPTDLQPVFDIIAESAAKLCSAEVSVVTRYDGEWVELEAVYGSSSVGTAA